MKSFQRSTILPIVAVIVIVTSSCHLFDSTPPPAPILSPASGTYIGGITVTMVSVEPDCRIYYTTNSREPTASSKLYKTPFFVSTFTIVKAISVDKAGNQSEPATAIYTIEPDPLAPLISEVSATFADNTSVTLTAAVDTTVYYTYTTDGSTPGKPTVSDTAYSATIMLSALPGGSVRYRYAFRAFSSTGAGESITVHRDWTIDRRAEAPFPAAPFNAILDIPNNRITGTTIEMEYTTNDGGSWTDCGGGIVELDLSVGNRVWVRDKTDTTETNYLGAVLATTGPDLVGGEFLYVGTGNWNDEYIAAPGEIHSIFYAPSNSGTTSVNSNTVTVAFYLSDDRVFTTDDTLLETHVYPYTTELTPPTGGAIVDFTVPGTPGNFYVGMIIDTTNAAPELNEDNNTTIPDQAAFLTIEDDTAPPPGAIKIVNSWGIGGNWENNKDGHYWLTYDTIKSLQLSITYYHNNFDSVYEPRVLAVFNLTHLLREECLVTLGLGDPADPYLSKEFQIRWSTDIQSGPEPFPDNHMALDISEFSAVINDFDLFLSVENTGDSTGTINSFDVEFYNDYDQAPFKTISASSGGVIPSNDSIDISIATTGSLTDNDLFQILALPRVSTDRIVFHEEKPDAIQLAKDKQTIGVYQEGRNYNVLHDGKYGTGYEPPSDESWDQMVRLTAVDAGMPMGELPLEVDHSLTQYFPPIGSQGIEGSCTAFSFAYYIHTYTEAREHGWDLSGALWYDQDPSGGDNQGGPSLAYANKIFSPDFVYHAINDGTDTGSSPGMAATLLARIGCATWAAMPYDTTDSTSWPSEAAFREAPRYRSQTVNTSTYFYGYDTSGYFTIEDNADIQLLKTLLSAGYCVLTVIYTDGLYALFDSNDVVSGYTGGNMSTNHAQTVVGYKEGAEWNESNPDG
jgi:hypothetical protein